MGAYKKGSQAIYFNVNSGEFQHRLADKTIEIYDGYVGVITGIRLVRNYFNDRASGWLLQIRMEDPSNSDVPVILSGTIFMEDAKVTTWGRMIVARLANPEHKLATDEVLDIGVYSPKDIQNKEGASARASADSTSTCASLRRAGDASALKGIDLQKDNGPLCYQLTLKYTHELITKYGWGDAATDPKGPWAEEIVEEEEWDFPGSLDEERSANPQLLPEDAMRALYGEPKVDPTRFGDLTHSSQRQPTDKINEDEIDTINMLGNRVYGERWPISVRAELVQQKSMGFTRDLTKLLFRDAREIIKMLNQELDKVVA